MTQCVKLGASALSFNSPMINLYKGGMSGNGRLSIRNEKTRAVFVFAEVASRRGVRGDEGERVERR